MVYDTYPLLDSFVNYCTVIVIYGVLYHYVMVITCREYGIVLFSIAPLGGGSRIFERGFQFQLNKNASSV